MVAQFVPAPGSSSASSVMVGQHGGKVQSPGQSGRGKQPTEITVTETRLFRTPSHSECGFQSCKRPPAIIAPRTGSFRFPVSGISIFHGGHIVTPPKCATQLDNVTNSLGAPLGLHSLPVQAAWMTRLQCWPRRVKMRPSLS